MAYNPSMAYAVSGNSASSAEYNKVVDNVTDLNTRVVANTATNSTQDDRLTALEGASAVVGAWTAVTSFANSWANRGTGFFNLKARLLPGSNVQLVGNITKAAGGINGEQIGTLPSSTFFPPQEVVIPIMDSSGSRAIGLRIDTAGKMYLYFTGGATNSAASLNIFGTFPGASSGA